MKLKCVSNYRKGMMNGYDFRDAFEVGKSYSFVTSHYAYYVYSDRKGWVKVYIADFIVVFVPEDGVVDPESFQGQFIKETMKLAAKKLKMSVPTVCASYEAKMINLRFLGCDWHSSIYPVLFDYLFSEWTFLGDIRDPRFTKA
jgi:hypothetical protein